MYSFLQAELSDIRVVLQKVSGSQIARGVSSEMVVRLFLMCAARHTWKEQVAIYLLFPVMWLS